MSAAATAACPPPPSLQAPFGANGPFSAGSLHTGTQERGCAAELGSRLGPCVLGRLAALAGGWPRRRSPPLCPQQLMCLQLAPPPPPPPPPPRLGNKHLFLQKNKKGEVTGVVAVLST